ncbi:DUF6880 family protein [Methylobacterium sp. P5_C11]
MARPRRVTPAAPAEAPIRPKGARRTTPSPETLAALGPDRLIGLILGETARNPTFKKLVSAALAALQGPDAVAAIVDRRLTALEGAQGFIDWQKRRSFAADLNATVTVILDELRPLDPGAALDRLLRFLDAADAVLNRVDDSTGAVQGVFERASDAVVAMTGSLPPDDAVRVAASLVARCASEPLGPHAAVLGDMIPSLPEEALGAVDQRLAATDAAQATDCDLDRGATHHRRAGLVQILRLRQAIADRRGDVDAYIALEGALLPGRESRAEIARRLLDAGRPGEALDWIRRPQEPGSRIATRADLIAGFDPRGPDRARQALEIEILDTLGRADEAQALRWARFERDLDAPMLRTYLAKLPDFEDEEALQRALDWADAFPQPHRALAFLVGWPDLNRAAGLVTARPQIWQGDQYAVLAPAAEALSQDHPVAATILYRRLLDDILESGRSAAYPHGARYLAELDGLAGRLAAGDVTPDPQTYRHDLRRMHGRKHAFWGSVRD